MEPFFTLRNLSKQKKNIYPQEDLKVGLVYQKKGLDAQATKFFNSYAAFCEKDESIYKSMNLAMKYVNAGKNDQAIAQLNVFATQENYFYWILIYLEIDPLMKPLKNHPEFKEVIQKIEDRFWKNQTQLRKSLEEKGLI
jgi:hypothetical protein